ncbi:MAG: 1-deoxy-D-xylulose-5-phosphate reductoisomerase [Chthonomonas sp.]|nr:1-deoxy-D-xylulose-5-phosphate reductoisomerase [Chthonomonas sp.]
MKRIVVLGSTGSIGTQTLDVAREHPDRLQVVGLVAHRSAAALQAQAAEFAGARVALMDEAAADAAGLPGGMNAVLDMVSAPDVDLVVVSVAGVIGLLPTLRAIECGKDIALASKEVLVAAGEVVMREVRARGITLTPIDSEHSAVFQCVQGAPLREIDELILTASGGPFFGRKRSELAKITVAEALNHPTWAMGGKITIDSATLMNKGLEIIEARWLFDTPLDRVRVVVHRQSIIHSMVKFTDGSVLGQMGWPNMRLPIQYALLYPERPPSGLRDWNPIDSPTLTFAEPDTETFGCLALAREAGNAGQTYPCALNAANEEAANRFLRDEIPFLGIEDAVRRVVEAHQPVEPTLDNLLAVDAAARAQVRQWNPAGSISVK